MIISVKVKTRAGYAVGRKGVSDMSDMEVRGCEFTAGTDTPYTCVYLNAFDLGGSLIRGGLGGLTFEEMDELCRKWLEARGKNPDANKEAQP